MQTAIVILIVAACVGWMAVQAYHFVKPKPNGKHCAGGCCDGDASMAPSRPATATEPASARPPRQMMISSDDIRARLKARQR